MIDPLQTLRARAAAGGTGEGNEPAPVRIGMLAPYPVWFALFLVVRGAQVVFLVCVLWFVAAIFDAIEKPHNFSTPPYWLWVASIVLGAAGGRRIRWRGRLSPLGDWIGNALASQQCPACGQNIFDHTPPSGYAPDTQRHSLVPSRVCANCGHDLMKRMAS
jgi:hypothetical protein